MPSVDAARDVVLSAIADRVFPAAVVEVGSTGTVLWRDAFGTLTFDDPSRPTLVQTPFDLASLTKVVATTSVIMELTGAGSIGLGESAGHSFPEWRGEDRERVTVRDLLEHASGLPARLLDVPGTTRREFEHDICTIALEYRARSTSVYSDLDFILLGFLAADRAGASLAAQWNRIAASLLQAGDVLTFELPPDLARHAAPTLPMDDDLRRGRVLAGEVHDNYAHALGGIAGHAGLFGTAPALGVFANAVLRASRGDRSAPPPFTPDLVSTFTTKSTVPGSSRALGWDTMLPTSSCGTRMSPAAFGHVGYTGTSLWIDRARDRYFILLTNRVAGAGTIDQMRTVRRAFHDALGDI
jgi:serine-type D-Ala-D-Ala carboxypeptidase